ncbi:MAG: acyl-CoA dehydrogenase C-terminal domain-containing protein [Desulfobacter sp.]|nr:acyl-CoA dehydrogenase C-terminal domain-containing protein [Desulfobacter sp.]
MKKGQYFTDLLGEINQTVESSGKIKPIAPLADALDRAASRAEETAVHLGTLAMGDLLIGWMMLQRAEKAAVQLEKILDGLDEKQKQNKISTHKKAAFYQGQISTAEFFIHGELSVTLGKFDAICATCDAAVTIPEMAFGA